MTLNPRLTTYGMPRSKELTDALATRFRVLPRAEARSTQPRREHCGHFTLGGVYDRDGNLEHLAEREGGHFHDRVDSISPFRLWREEPSASGVFLPGRSAYLGYWMDHYGHFLTEFLSRCWFAGQEGRFNRYVVFPFIFSDGQVLVREYQRYMLQALGLPADEIIVLAAETKFERLFVPEQLWRVNHSANAVVRRVYERIAAPHRGANTPDKVFLSRGPEHVPGRFKGYKRISNVAEVEAVFRESGFAVVNTEATDIRQQLDVYANASVVAGFSGSGMHNCLFGKAGSLWIDVGDTRMPADHHVMQKIAYQTSDVTRALIPYSGTPEGAYDLDHLRREIARVA